MKALTSLAHKFTLFFKAEEIIVKAQKYIPVLYKLMPLPSEYKPNQEMTVKRNGVNFTLQLTDYMQWHVFADKPDISWQKATEFITEGSSVMDVGANIGAFSLQLAKKLSDKKINTTIHAFEPNPYIYKRFQNNLQLNPPLQSFVSIHPLALGSENGEASIVFTDNNSGGGQIHAKAENNSVPVQIKTLDSFVEENKIENISFIKIDVEGFEPFVLKGAQATILREKPKLYIEITDEWFRKHGSSAEEVIQLLKSWGYQIYVEIKSGLVPLEKVTDIHTLYQYNILCV
ncbi:MAG: FkbM family methyltransferase [Cytophagaceae bacterium]